MPLLNGPAIREAIDSLGMPLQVAAERAGLSSIGLSHIIARRQPGSVVIAYRIARVLELRADQVHPDLLPDPRCARTARQRREVQGVKAAEMAYTVECSLTHYVNVEAGFKKPSPELLDRIARALGCQPADIARPRTPPWTLEDLARRDAGDGDDTEPEPVLAGAGTR